MFLICNKQVIDNLLADLDLFDASD